MAAATTWISRELAEEVASARAPAERGWARQDQLSRRYQPQFPEANRFMNSSSKEPPPSAAKPYATTRTPASSSWRRRAS